MLLVHRHVPGVLPEVDPQRLAGQPQDPVGFLAAACRALAAFGQVGKGVRVGFFGLQGWFLGRLVTICRDGLASRVYHIVCTNHVFVGVPRPPL